MNALKNIFAGVILLSHINFSMFIAQVDEVDNYDSHGRQANDINSLAEYVDQVVFGNENKIPDSDDDNARYFHLVKVVDYCFSQQCIQLAASGLYPVRKQPFPLTGAQELQSGFQHIITPPPKA